LKIWDEYGGLIILVAFVLVLIIGVGGMLAALSSNNSNQRTACEQAKHDLSIQGYYVVEGQINSPTAIEITNNYQYFTSATPKNITIYEAYLSSKGTALVAVFNMTYGLAYQPEYKTNVWWIW
jgi:hypothetical protein